MRLRLDCHVATFVTPRNDKRRIGRFADVRKIGDKIKAKMRFAIE